MYERLTDRSRKVIQLANLEAQRLGSKYIDTDHVLFGLAKEGSGVAANILQSLGVEPLTITDKITRHAQESDFVDPAAKLRQTPQLKAVIEYAMEEARNLGHNYVGTEHLLLGLLRDDGGSAARILMNLGLRLEQVRANTLALLGVTADEGSILYSQARIQPSDFRPLDDDTKRHVRQLADAIAPLEEAKWNAVASQDFAEAARLRDQQDQMWKEMKSLNLPAGVIANLKRFVDNWPRKVSRFPVLDRLDEESGAADSRVVAVLPNPLVPPVKVVVGVVPPHPVSTLKAVLGDDDICSPYFQARVPLISPESVGRVQKDRKIMVRVAFHEIARGINTTYPSLFNPVLLCAVRPTLLAEDVKNELLAGIRRTNCDFVVFEDADTVPLILDSLPPETRPLDIKG